MGTIITDKVQTNELTAKGGSKIPGTLVPLSADAYGCFVNGAATDALNVSSVTKTAKSFTIAFNNRMTSKNYSVLALRNGALSNSTVYSADYDAPTKSVNSIQIILRASGVAGITCDNWCFLVFCKGGTI